MIVKYTLLLIVLISSKSVFSQDFWEQLYFPDSTSIMCLTTNDQMNLFVGVANDGISGGVYRSLDSSQTWELVLDVGNFMVQSIDINENGDIFIGRTGFNNFMKSNDNGSTWIDLVLPSNNNVMKILCKGQDTLFVSLWEDNGALLVRSIDGGVSWDSLFTTANTSEYISDIAISNTGEIYISLTGFFASTGGVFKSNDDGATWTYINLLNHQVNALAINSIGEVFSGDWHTMSGEYPGIYSLSSGDEEFSLIYNTYGISEMDINSEDDLYVNDHLGVLRSLDSGLSFDYINEGISGAMQEMHIDIDDYIYVARNNFLAKSINSTITSIENKKIENNQHKLVLYPNPATDIISIGVPFDFSNTHQETINIFNTLGLPVATEIVKYKNKNIQIDVSFLTSGLYFIEINSENIKLISKFIKK